MNLLRPFGTDAAESPPHAVLADRVEIAEDDTRHRGGDATADAGSEEIARLPAPRAAALRAGTPQTTGEDSRDTRPAASPLSRTPSPAFADTADDVGARFSISGRVQDDFGHPVSGIEIKAVRSSSRFTRGHTSAEPRSTFTSFDGYYSLGDMPDGDYTVSTVASELYTAATAFVRAGSQTADLVVSERMDVRVAGTVTNTSGEALEGVAVTPVSIAMPPSYSDQGGRFEFVVPVQVFRSSQHLRFRHARHHDAFESLHVPESPEHNPAEERPAVKLDVRMAPLDQLSALAGSVSAPGGVAVAHQFVQLYSPGLKRHYSAVTDATGHFELPMVAAAPDYIVRVHSDGSYRDYERRHFEVAGTNATLNIMLSPLDYGRVTGQMVDLYGDPIPDFKLWLRSEHASLGWVPVSGDRSGRYVVSDAPSGQLVFRTQSFPSFHVRGPALTAGAEEEVPLVLDLGDYAIYGRVENSYGDPIATPDVFLYWSHHQDRIQSQSTRRAMADGYGNFQFVGLGPGVHRVSVAAPGYRSTQVSYDVGSMFETLVVRLEELQR